MTHRMFLYFLFRIFSTIYILLYELLYFTVKEEISFCKGYR